MDADMHLSPGHGFARFFLIAFIYCTQLSFADCGLKNY
jgi:hypothetical protein